VNPRWNVGEETQQRLCVTADASADYRFAIVPGLPGEAKARVPIAVVRAPEALWQPHLRSRQDIRAWPDGRDGAGIDRGQKTGSGGKGVIRNDDIAGLVIEVADVSVHFLEWRMHLPPQADLDRQMTLYLPAILRE
jgi:hypothetical protein